MRTLLCLVKWAGKKGLLERITKRKSIHHDASRFEDNIELNSQLILDFDGSSCNAHGSHPEIVLS
jgi:hypothetical protein